MMRTFLLTFICLLSLPSVGQAQTVFKDGKISRSNFLPTAEQEKEIRALAEIRLPSPSLPKCKGSPTIIRTEEDYNRVINLWKNCTGELTAIFNGQYVAKFFGELGPNGKPHGVGIATWYEAHPEFNKFRKYVGEFKNDRREGRGVLTLADGSTQEGVWENDSFKREEILRSASLSNLPACRSSFSVQWSNCVGTLTFADGSKYVGEFKDGEYSGNGNFTFGKKSKHAGDQYIGQFKASKKDGHGTYTYANGNKYVGEYKDGKINGHGTYTYPNGHKYVGEFKDDKRNGHGTYTYSDGSVLKGIWKDDKFQYAKKPKPSSSTVIASNNNAKVAELTAAQRKAERLEAELAALKAAQQEEEQRISSDTQIPLITASSRRESETNALIVGKITDNVEVVEVTVDGEPVRLGSSGSFETSFYVPRNGKVVEIVAFDSKGNKATKSIKLERGAIQQATGPVFANLNPSGKRVSQNKDALALIIGVSDYERTPAKAAYADKDAQTFYDYAMLKLGIPANNIKELVNTNADEADVRLAVKDWIARITKQGRSDVYVFFAGHGLADQTGKKMFLLPHDGEPRLLEDTAISRERLFSDIAAANPRSVTVFLDTCYSGTTRGADMLVASRPIAIRAKQQNIPDGFTVFTAAGGDQTAKPLEEAKHGMFSYFLMKGMEGDADSNSDNQITAAELHEYVEQNVVQQSGGSQVPELQGDAGRVLVRFQ